MPETATVNTSRGRSGLAPVRRLALCAGLMFLSFASMAVHAQAEDAPLKPAVPKLDTLEESINNSLLKGGVEHRIQKLPPAPAKKKVKKLDLNARNDAALQAGLKARQEAERLMRQRASVDSEDRPQKFEYKIDRSIGIIGVKFLKVSEKPPVINRVFPGTPAWNSGLQVNDIIVAVDGVPTYGLSKDECYDLIVGTPNTPVTISVMRHGGFMAKTMTRMDFNDIPDPAVRRDYLRSL